ncbi:EamA family transporter [Paenibacillus sp. YPG26]|uniref:DMT family transporter n=1 Tax=Paenibacillus sp. YPG26 TaxID=2878915 RepID=UPI00203E138D|nr:EamA family transporter [Paenibacillus sp. YPG26]USB33792.1 EamA family transporter [Paenibacillus sp. YPG26]
MIYLAFSVMCLIFGTTFLAIKWGIDAGLTPFFGGGFRFFLAGLILFGFMVWRRKAPLALLLRKEMMLTGLGLTFGTFATLYWAEQYISSGIAAVLSATGPIMILLLQTIFLRQRTRITAVAGCLIGFAGVALLLLPGITVHTSRFWILASVTILIGEIFYAGGALYSKHVMPRFQGISPIALNAAQMMYGGGGLLVMSFFTEDVHLHSLLEPQAIYSLLYLIVIGSMVAHSIFYWLVARTTPLFPSTWLYISPVIALLLGMLLYHEPVSWNTLAGVLVIISGLILINAPALRQLFGRKISFNESGS